MPTKQIAWQTGSGNITLTYQGQGDGHISVVSDVNDGAARSQIITIQTTKGGLVTKNVTVSQAACPIPIGTVLNYNYTGNYQEVTLPAGKYKLQCWGAQGGSNAAASSYNITAKAGGKGGYSEGVITLSQATTFRVYVGGQGSSSAGGFNGGGSTTGSSSYNSGNEEGVSRMGGGGGATDIRLSDGALLSRMIVAGGGSGGAMCYKKEIIQSEKRETINWEFPRTKGIVPHGTTVDWVFEDPHGRIGNMDSHSASGGNMSYSGNGDFGGIQVCLDLSQYIDRFPVTVTFNVVSAGGSANLRAAKAVDRTAWQEPYISEFVVKSSGTGSKSITLDDITHPVLFYYCNDNKPGMSITGTQVSWYDSLRSYSASEGNASWSSLSDDFLDDVVMGLDLSPYSFPIDVEFTINSSGGGSHMFLAKSALRTSWDYYSSELIDKGNKYTGNVKVTLTDSTHPYLFFYCNDNKPGMSVSGTARVYYEPVTSESTDYQTGFVGGGTTGGGYSSSYQGKQNAAGSGGSFGQGANQTTTNYRYCSGAGGGGWYGGGGGQYSDSYMDYCKYSGGGSGWVNIPHLIVGETYRFVATNASKLSIYYTRVSQGSSDTGKWTSTSSPLEFTYRASTDTDPRVVLRFEVETSSSTYSGSASIQRRIYSSVWETITDITSWTRVTPYGGKYYYEYEISPTSSSSGNRPSGYTGLQLDSGTTYAGNTSFVAPGGGNETGHAGNGYARITRLS